MRIAKIIVNEGELSENATKEVVLFYVERYSYFTKREKAIIKANIEHVMRDIKAYWKEIDDWNASMQAPY